jgi:hypothetical protein
MTLEEIHNMLYNFDVRDLDNLVDFMIGFERKAAKLHKGIATLLIVEAPSVR